MATNAAKASVPSDLYVLAGKYALERIIGEGGMGVVYAAMHLELEQRVAVKVVRQDLATNEEVNERTLREARIAARFRSEHVARVLDAGRVESGAPFIVMEYLEGEDLRSHLLRGGPLTVDVAVTFLLQACEALAEAHAEGIIHRDLKPDNLFVTARTDGTAIVKVLDFGISKCVAEDDRRVLTNPALVVGSPDYMAPEQMRAGGVVDRRSDIWSLGAVLYELLSGHRPFAAATVPQVCARVLTEAPPKLRSIEPDAPAELEIVIARCLERSPDRRYANVAELARALAPYGRSGSQELAERIERVESGIRRRPEVPSARSSRPSVPPRESHERIIVDPEPAVLRQIAPPPLWSPKLLLVALVIGACAAAGVASRYSDDPPRPLDASDEVRGPPTAQGRR